MRNVGAADVEQPGDVMGVADRQTIRLQRRAHPFEFRPRAFSTKAGLVQRHLPQRRRRTVRPNGIDRIGIDGDEFTAGFLASSAQTLDGIGRVQPGIVAKPAAVGQVSRRSRPPAARRSDVGA